MEPGRAVGFKVFSLTAAGRRRLAGGVRLPESPQHRLWRVCRATAEANAPRFRAELEDALRDGLALLAPGACAHSDVWAALETRLQRACARVAAAVYCASEWREPSDEQRDEPNKARTRHVSDIPGPESAALHALGRTIRRIRRHRNLSETALAHAAGIGPDRLAAIEAGQLDPCFDGLIALADALGVPSAELVGDIEVDAGDAR